MTAGPTAATSSSVAAPPVPVGVALLTRLGFRSLRRVAAEVFEVDRQFINLVVRREIIEKGERDIQIRAKMGVMRFANFSAPPPLVRRNRFKGGVATIGSP